MKQAFRAVRGERAEKIRCMKSMATMSPMPSEIRVAQLIGAPPATVVSCSKANGPIPSGALSPNRKPTHTSNDTDPTTVITIWTRAV